MCLSDGVYKRITELSERGNSLLENGEYLSAISTFEEALSILPSFKEQLEAWTWLAATIGDAFYLQMRFAEARNWFNEARKGPGGIGNPFIQLRLGQVARKLGDEKRAVDELLRAYMGDGELIFEGEPDDFAFLKSRVKL